MYLVSGQPVRPKQKPTGLRPSVEQMSETELGFHRRGVDVLKYENKYASNHIPSVLPINILFDDVANTEDVFMKNALIEYAVFQYGVKAVDIASERYEKNN